MYAPKLSAELQVMDTTGNRQIVQSGKGRSRFGDFLITREVHKPGDIELFVKGAGSYPRQWRPIESQFRFVDDRRRDNPLQLDYGVSRADAR